MNRSSTAQHRLRQLGLAGEPADHLRPPLDLLQRPLQQVRRAQPLAKAQRVGEVNAERRQVVGEAGGRARVRALQVGDEPPEPRLTVRRRGGIVERRPIGRLHPLPQLGVLLVSRGQVLGVPIASGQKTTLRAGPNR
jgi:hypothetical protein